MWRSVGIERREEDLAEADTLIGFWQSYVLDKVFDEPSAWELQNMLILGRLMTASARMRTESRGVHHRDDYPERDDRHWAGHIQVALGRGPWLEPMPGGPSDRDLPPPEG